MTPNPAAVGRDDSPVTAARVMEQQNVGSVPRFQRAGARRLSLVDDGDVDGVRAAMVFHQLVLGLGRNRAAPSTRSRSRCDVSEESVKAPSRPKQALS